MPEPRTLVYGNRALGILKRFLESPLVASVESWLLPGSVCFSVPFLFLDLGKRVYFYDIGHQAIEDIEIQLEACPNTGVLLVNYYGQAWPKELVARLRPHTPCLIMDACLSVPDFSDSEIANTADLVLFSTGQGKVLSIGQGAFGLLPLAKAQTLEMKPLLETQRAAASKVYYQLDNYWKGVVKGTHSFNYQLFESIEIWVDTGVDCDITLYQAIVSEKLPAILAHKATLNQLYRQELPSPWQVSFASDIWRYHLLVDKPAVLLEALFGAGLFASNHYANAQAYLSPQSPNLPYSNQVAAHIVNLFNDPAYTEAQALQTCQVIKKLFDTGQIQPIELNITL